MGGKRRSNTSSYIRKINSRDSMNKQTLYPLPNRKRWHPELYVKQGQPS